MRVKWVGRFSSIVGIGAVLSLTGCGSSTAGSDLDDVGEDTALVDGASPAGDTASSTDGAATDSGSRSDLGTRETATTEDTSPALDVALDTITDTSGCVDSTVASGDFTKKGPLTVTTGTAKIGGADAHLVYPTGATTCPRSAVVFAHGFQLKATQYDQILTHLASWGYVVVSVEYTSSFIGMDHRKVRDAIVAGKKALADGSIGVLPAVDGKKILAMGHSLGGKGAIMAVLADPTFAGAFTFDPVDGNPGNPLGGAPSDATPQLAPTETAKIAVPIGYLGASQSRCEKSTFGLKSACAPEKVDAKSLFNGTTTAPSKYYWSLFDFGHMQFLDDPKCGTTCDACVAGTSPRDPRLEVAKGLVVAFARRVLSADVTTKSYLEYDQPKTDEWKLRTLIVDPAGSAPVCPK